MGWTTSFNNTNYVPARPRLINIQMFVLFLQTKLTASSSTYIKFQLLWTPSMDGRTATCTAAMDTFRWGSEGGIVLRMGAQQQDAI